LHRVEVGIHHQLLARISSAMRRSRHGVKIIAAS
jgi:hypothetical protein